ncbi:hypothetical protein QUB60_17805 [Microcoleus sp. A2-C5]|uniref:hypothetical protein n=1 Tax=Microcoleaceae TaxID=1892252 RepID=UPI0022371F8A|nr:hypothetical protein [Lyngbya sp. CCAP 1446/10]MCW6049532.1 hypothetical protein [Lyngbya sp. CCAP 1446/10]
MFSVTSGSQKTPPFDPPIAWKVGSGFQGLSLTLFDRPLSVGDFSAVLGVETVFLTLLTSLKP